MIELVQANSLTIPLLDAWERGGIQAGELDTSGLPPGDRRQPGAGKISDSPRVRKRGVMKERPIIFNAENVRAILDGRKTQTRRVVKPGFDLINSDIRGVSFIGDPKQAYFQLRGYSGDAWEPSDENPESWVDENPESWVMGTPCFYGKPGDLLWVRETWLAEAHPMAGARIRYRAGGNMDVTGLGKEAADSYKHRDGWRSPRFMYRWASRITLEIKSVRVERLKAIDQVDIVNEGITNRDAFEAVKVRDWPDAYSAAFSLTWDSINAKRGYSWESNPWVWVIEFERTAEHPEMSE